jgi:hypothetical protein
MFLKAKRINTITTTIIVMTRLALIVLDLLKAVVMQISLRNWEMHMIKEFGFDWKYRDFWQTN